MNLKRDVKPITYLKSRTSAVVKEVSEHGRTIVITQNGEAKMVVMGVETYESWQSAAAMLKILALSEADIKAGRVSPHDKALQRIARMFPEAKSGRSRTK